MPLTFATPLLLAAVAAIAIPVLVHLIIREERSGRPFPSLMFIRRIPIEARRRRTLRDRALLALRCLAILLLALAFAGPRLSGEPPPAAAADTARDTVLLLDRSYSMSQPQRWRAAIAAAEARIDTLAGAARMAIVAFDHEASLIAPLTDARGVLRARLRDLEPGVGGTRLGAAFDLAGRLLAESRAAERQLVVISDLQRSALTGVDRLFVDGQVSLELVPVMVPVGANAAVMSAALVPLSHNDREGQGLAVRVRNTGSVPLNGMELSVEIDGRIAHSQRIDLAVDEEQSHGVPVVLARDRTRPARILLSADEVAADNVHHLVLMPDAPIEVGLVTDSDLFVRQALAVAADPTLRAAPWSGPDAATTVVIAGDGVFADPETRRQLEQFSENGGNMLIYLTNSTPVRPPASTSPALPPGLGGLRHHPGAGAAPIIDSGLGWVEDTEEIGAALAGTRLLMSRRIDAADSPAATRVLARLSDGTPWLIEHSFGGGRTLLINGGLAGPWGNLALEPGFVPLLQALVRHLARRAPATPAHTPAQAIDLAGHAAALPGGGDWHRYLAAGGHLVVELPDGGQQPLAPREGVFRADRPGLYEAHRADGRPPSLAFAVNPDRRESLFAAATRAEVQGRITRRTAPRRPAGAAWESGAQRTPRPLGWYLLALAAALLWLEAQVANWLTWRRVDGGGGGRRSGESREKSVSRNHSRLSPLLQPLRPVNRGQ